MKPTRRHGLRAAAAAATAAAVLAACTNAGSGSGSSDEAFEYSGQRVEIVVPFAAGGGTDTLMRAIAPHLARHLDGKATVQVVNRDGASGVPGTNQFEAGRRDGTSLLATQLGTTVFSYLLGDSNVKFDPRDWEPLLTMPGGSVVYISPDTGYQDPADLSSLGRLETAAIDPMASPQQAIVLAFSMLGLDVHVNWGYEGGGARRVAFEQGESDIDHQSTSAYAQSVTQLVDAGEAIPLFSLGYLEGDEIVRDPAAPDLPTFPEFYEEVTGQAPSGLEFDAYKSLVPIGSVKQLFIHGDEDPAIIDAWHRAVESFLADADALDELETVLEGYTPFAGEQMAKMMDVVWGFEGSQLDYVVDLMVNDYDAVIAGR